MILKNGKRIDGTYDNIPVGTIQAFVGLNAPEGYLLCNGQRVNKMIYHELYELCGDLFGQSTETEFYLPDLRGKTLAGYDENDVLMNTVGKLLGNKNHVHATKNHTLTEAEMPRHNHNIMTQAGINSDNNLYYINLVQQESPYMDPNLARYTGGNQPHNHGDTTSSSSFQPTITTNWIIKAYMIQPNYSIVEDNLTSDSSINALSAKQGKLLNNNKIDKSVIQTSYNNGETNIYSCSYLNTRLPNLKQTSGTNSPKQYQDCYDKWIKVCSFYMEGSYNRMSCVILMQDQNNTGLFSAMCNTGNGADTGYAIVQKIAGNCRGNDCLVAIEKSSSRSTFNVYVRPSYYGRGQVVLLSISGSYIERFSADSNYSSNGAYSWTDDQITGTKIFSTAVNPAS